MTQEERYNKLLRRVAKNLKRLRQVKRLTQEEMREKGFGYRHYQRLESGSYSPNLHTLFRLSEALNVDVKDFFK